MPHFGVSIDPNRKIKLCLFLFVISILVFISGARLVSSDEVSMYLTIESLVKSGTFAIPLENAPNSSNVDGKSYTWYEAGNILAGIPFYCAGNIAASILPLSESLKSFIPRAAVSLTGAFFGGWIAVLFFSVLRKLGVSLRVSIGMALALTLSTFLLPYFKMFMREPILALCLLGACGYLLPGPKNRNNDRALIVAGIFTGYGILTKLAFAINLLPLLVYIYRNDNKDLSGRLREVLLFLIPVFILGLGGTMMYNFLRFGNPMNIGYAGGTSFTTPVFVGLYGLLLSPGKGILWFAPMLFLLIPSHGVFRKKFPRETYLIAVLFLANLLLSSVYVAWGGDGSWGPRYLAPLLPLIFLPVSLYLDQATRTIKRIALTLALFGFIIQLGGISIYAGAYLREIGEYPYQRDIGDPEFLYKAHFIPNYSPVIGHWRMLSRNAIEHLEGNYPQFSVIGQAADNRLPIADDEKSKLLHTIDFWFTYALYANISKKIIFTVAFLLLGLCGISGFLLNRVTLKNH